MRYRTVKEIIEFVRELRAIDTADNLLCIHLEFYEGDGFVGELVKNMYSEYISVFLIDKYLSDYFVLSIKKPSSI